MKHLLPFLLLLLHMVIMPPLYACDVQDDFAHPIKMAHPATRIISLAPDTTEILFAIKADKEIVGVIAGSDYPKPAQYIKRVGSYTGLDIEAMIALHPDLIVMYGDSFKRQLNIFEAMHVPIYMTNPHHLHDISRTIQAFGCLTGKVNEADHVARLFSHEQQMLFAKYHAKMPLTVFYQLGADSLMTVNKDSWINEVITACGGINLFANAKWQAPLVADEALITANPDVILSDATGSDWSHYFSAWPMLKAVKYHALYTINPDWLERAGPRLVLGMQAVCMAIDHTRQSLTH